jgi:hypothetical protein
MDSVHGAASAPVSTAGRASAGGAHVTTARPGPISAAHRARNAPIVRTHRWVPIAGAHRLSSGHPSWAPTGERRVLIRGAHRWRSERPSGAVIGGRPYPITRPSAGGGGPSAAIYERGASGLLLAVATAAHAG